MSVEPRSQQIQWGKSQQTPGGVATHNDLPPPLHIAHINMSATSTVRWMSEATVRLGRRCSPSSRSTTHGGGRVTPESLIAKLTTGFACLKEGRGKGVELTSLKVSPTHASFGSRMPRTRYPTWPADLGQRSKVSHKLSRATTCPQLTIVRSALPVGGVSPYPGLRIPPQCGLTPVADPAPHVPPAH